MWYKIVLNKDGSVASCEEAAPSLDEGRCVLFVEAASKQAAIEAAKVRRNSRKLAYDAKLKALGLCVDCRKPAALGKTKCPACIELQRTRDRARANGAYIPLTPEQRSQLRTGRKHTNNERLILLYECRRVFDERGAKAFRAWLQSEIDASFGETTAAQ